MMLTVVIVDILPHDVMHKRGLCRRAVAAWVSVCPSRSCSKRLKILSQLLTCYGTRVGNRTVPRVTSNLDFKVTI